MALEPATEAPSRAAQKAHLSPRARLVCILVYLVGVAWRCHYIFVVHPATRYVYSDMQGYLDRAQKLLDPASIPFIGDAFYPPGMSFFLAFFYGHDPTGKTALLAQLVLSCLIPILVWFIGSKFFGPRPAALAFMATSLYFPLIDYASFFLSENPFTFFMLASFACLVSCVDRACNTRAAILALIGGVLLGVATAFRNVASVPALLVAVVLWVGATAKRWSLPWTTIPSAMAGVALILIPLSLRATHINEGRPCLVSTNWAINVMQGHYGPVATFRFKDRRRNASYEFASPAALQRGWTDSADLPFGPYDTERIMGLTLEHVRTHPWSVLVQSIDNVFSLFGGTVPWPTSHTEHRTAMVFSQQLFLVLVLWPASFHLFVHARRLGKLERALLGDILMVLPVTGLMVIAFFTNAEPRYRIPFDPFLILLASRFYVGPAPSAERVEEVGGD